MSRAVIREARGPELRAGAGLLATALGFGDRDAIPPWLMQTTGECGGIALGAFDDEADRLIGFSYAVPTASGQLYSCGLAIEPAERGQGLGRRLKLAQRDWAAARGVSEIRWTARPTSAPALKLYLSGLGARLTGYRAGLFAGVREDAAADDAEIVWVLDGPRRPLTGPEALVEIPLDPARGPAAAARVRREMCVLLERGCEGVGVCVDRATRRAWVRFAAEAPR